MGRMVATRGLSALFFLIALSAWADTSPSDTIFQNFQLSTVSHERSWLLLGHWDRTLRGFKSDVDGPDFFLAPRGRTDPTAELQASIEALFAPLHEGQDSNLHFTCRYPARTHWLMERFSIDRTLVRSYACKSFDDWYAALGHDAVSLVFASYYVNNPASMFGHTFLRLDSKDPETSDPLLSYSVNFAAETGGDNGLLFAVKGILGGYPGQYSTFPYYLKVLEYNNAENRVLWEYPLHFTVGEIDVLIRHLWELGRTSQSYYFFDKNCSYQLLALLEVARPTLDLRESISPFFVPPADTVKAFSRYPDLIGVPLWRPSVLLDLRHQLAGLSSSERRSLKTAVRKQSIDPLLLSDDPVKKAKMLDAAIVLMEYRNRHPIQTVYQKSLLLERSGLPPSSAPPLTHTTDAPPDQGHDSALVSIGGGALGSSPFIEGQFRPVFHDLLSNERAYPKRSEIIGMDLRGRYYTDTNDIRLERATLVQVLSLFPVEPFLIKPSWAASFGFETLYDNECGQCLHSYVRVGSGLASSFFRDHAMVYALAGAQGQFAPWNRIGYRIGPRAEAGWIISLGEAYTARMYATYSYSPLGSVSQTLEGSFEQRLSFTTNIDLRLTGTAGYDRREAKLTLGRYF